MSQTPNGGKLGKGETVTITVSKGQDPANKEIVIPSVVGMTQFSGAKRSCRRGLPLQSPFDLERFR